WESVRATAQRGQRTLALSRLVQLLALPDVPAALAAEGHRLAGELALDLGRLATARRHLTCAKTLAPTHAGAAYLAGRGGGGDPGGGDGGGGIGYKIAAELEGGNALYRAAFGRAAARCGKLRLGAREMLAATELAPGDVAVVRVAVNGLLEVGKVSEARQV